MKVIVAGFSKTGTKSMVLALTELGYTVHDVFENFTEHGDDWIKILTSGGNVEDFQRMYKNVDAVTDAPAFLHWEEIHRAFPQSRIILTIRDEDKWFESFREQMDQVRKGPIRRCSQFLSPTGRRFYTFYQIIIQCITGQYMRHPFDLKPLNEMLVRRKFRQHQTYCVQNAPRDKLLVYSVKEGWEPLCKFLGKDVPDKPFPHENIGGNIWEKKALSEPLMLKIRDEVKSYGLAAIAILAIMFSLLLKYVLF